MPTSIKSINTEVGETLVETLAAILIVTLATTMLLGSIQTARTITIRSQELEDQIRNANTTSIVYQTDGPDSDIASGTVQEASASLTVSDNEEISDSDANQECNLYIYSNTPMSDDKITIYKYSISSAN